MAAHVFNNEDDQDDQIERQRTLCIKNYGLDVLNSSVISNSESVCPAIWDGILCWGNTALNTVASQLCPRYIAGFDRPNYATRQCMNNGQWYISPESNNTWTNYTPCFSTQYATVVMELPSFNASLIEEYMPIIKVISRVGYFVSFSTLLVAFCIMFLIKKLHCARNKLHMHLFASFIFRAATAFLKDILFIDGVGMSSDMLMKDGKSYFIQQIDSNNWECKMFTSIWQYFITANYSWILMEGLYLHNLILLALFSDSNSSIKYYILLGWGLPALVVTPWIIARATLDDDFCWTTHSSHPSLFLIIRIPTMISNLINLVLFINIARVLLLKLRSPVSEEAKLYRRWARSTLVLVPLFGVHYALFLGMSYSMGINETVELVWLFCDQLFASFQGFFVAVLYCFLNGEVKTELKPHINNFISTCLRTPLSICFNCGESSRSAKARPSVCTTLSCSSLYNSTVAQKYPRKSRWDISQARHSIIHEKYMGNCQNCELNGKACQDLSTCWNGKYVHNCDAASAEQKCIEKYCICSNGGTQATEITACLGNQEHSCKTEPPIDLEMITIANR